MSFNVIYSDQDKAILNQSEQVIKSHEELLLATLRGLSLSEEEVHNNFMNDIGRKLLLKSHVNLFASLIPIRMEINNG